VVNAEKGTSEKRGEGTLEVEIRAPGSKRDRVAAEGNIGG